MGHRNFKLFEGIVALSVSSTWERAVEEWDLLEVWFVEKGEDPETCLCGHHPIKEVCVIKNHRNGKLAEVGNVCVNKFMGLPSEGIFQGLRRIQRDRDRGLNPAAVAFAFDKRWITKWEVAFCESTWRKRELSPRQWASRHAINDNVLARLRAAKAKRSRT